MSSHCAGMRPQTGFHVSGSAGKEPQARLLPAGAARLIQLITHIRQKAGILNSRTARPRMCPEPAADGQEEYRTSDQAVAELFEDAAVELAGIDFDLDEFQRIQGFEGPAVRSFVIGQRLVTVDDADQLAGMGYFAGAAGIAGAIGCFNKGSS